MHISKLSGKLEGFRSLSSDTTSNEFCKKMHGAKDGICTVCYSMKSLNGYRRNAVNALKRNDYLSVRPLGDSEIPKLMDKYFRIHAHGEIINLQHAENILKLIKANPQTFFGWWSKRKDIVAELFSKHKKPSNLNMIFSNSKIDAVMSSPPKYFDKTFNNITEGSANCTGQKCKDCLACYSKGTTDTIIEHVK